MNYLSYLTILFSLDLMALEIQCHTDQNEIDLVIKTSESSEITYLLLMSDSEVEKYWVLQKPLFHYNDSSFVFQDYDSLINIDLIQRVGIFQGKTPIYNDVLEIKLTNCLKF